VRLWPAAEVANVLSDERREQVLALGRLGWSLRRIESETGVRRETASAYLKAAGIPVRPSGSWGRRKAKPANEVSPDFSASIGAQNDQKAEAASSKPANEVSPDSGVLATPSPKASACEPYREIIERALEVGRNAKAIWQDLVDQHRFTAQYASVKRFIRRLSKERGADAHPVIVTPPGVEAQVDYGAGPMVRDSSGRYRRTRLFVLTLGFSRKSIRLLRFRSSSRIWAELHEEAFRRLGGVVRLVVLDNLREGVLEPDIYDPLVNKLYGDVLRHYGATAMPCRTRHADRKGKVESGVGHAKRTPLKGLRFESLEEAQAYLDHWEARWADTRIHGTTKRQVATMFEEERPHLLPLPLEPFRFWQRGIRTVDFYGCVEVVASFYSAPPGSIGRSVQVEWDDQIVRILDPATGCLLREHERQERGHRRIPNEDRSPRTPPSTKTLLEQAHRAGQRIGELAAQIHANDGDVGARRIRGLLALARKRGPSVVDDACALALEAGAPTYRFVRRYLDHRPALPLTLRQVDPLIRELTHYRDLIDRLTQEDST
jgi:transposase